ncbi:sce7726 family protein [Marinobacter sp. PE14]
MREREIKRALISHLDRYRKNQNDFPYLEELQINGGEVRADLVDVQSMHCYEIKSDLDTLARLHSQGSRYGKIFDKVTLVTSERHLEKALAMVPTWWGVMLIPQSGKKLFRRVRYARLNSRIDAFAIVSVLDKQEALDVLGRTKGTRGWKSKSLYILHQELANSISVESLKQEVRDCLSRRTPIDI